MRKLRLSDLRSHALVRIASASFAALAMQVPSDALAAGIEDTVAGTIALGRAANYVRVSDFMATWQNPANLALVPGADLGLELRMPVLRACFDRTRDPSVAYKRPDPATGFQGSESFAEVCNEASPSLAGNLGWAQSYGTWGYGVGFFTPAGSGSMKYGDDTIVTFGASDREQYPTTSTGAQSPSRQLLLSRRALAGFLMAGVGAQANRYLRVGLSAGLGFAYLSNEVVVSVLGGTFEDQEVVSKVTASDWLVPRMTGSVVVQPTDSLELMAQLTYSDDIRAKGDVELRANGIQGAPLRNCRSEQPGPHCKVSDAELHVPYHNLEATLGARFAQRRGPRREKLDPLRDEVWDIELDFFWAQTSNVDNYTLTVYEEEPGSPGAPRVAFSSAPEAAALPVKPNTVIRKDWRDTIGVRLGTDYNVIPSRLALRAGLSYSTWAVPVRTMNIDAWPVQKLGLHAGATVAFGRVSLSAAYAHIFHESVQVPLGKGALQELSSQMQEKAQVVNEGYYRSALDVFSLQGNVRF